jgi:hypothetical protein
MLAIMDMTVAIYLVLALTAIWIKPLTSRFDYKISL